jgi:hypothetical protein
MQGAISPWCSTGYGNAGLLSATGFWTASMSEAVRCTVDPRCPNVGAASSLPLAPRLYMRLPQVEKRRLRAEAALLCPQIVASSRQRGKYEDAVMYLLTYRGVLCHQARDLFSAGSVAGPARGGNYIKRSLKDIEAEMRRAAATLDDALFEEYWGKRVPPEDRIREWLRRADHYARGWRPSAELFQ